MAPIIQRENQNDEFAKPVGKGSMNRWTFGPNTARSASDGTRHAARDFHQIDF